MRQGVLTEYDPKRGVSIATLAYEYPPGYHVPEHAHGSDQVVYATRGVMEVTVAQSFWVIPPHFAIWIPARTLHQIRMPGAVSMRTLYVRRGTARRVPAECAVFHVGPLLRELIVEAVRIGQLRAGNRLHGALRDLVIWQLESASPVPTSITLPRDERGLAVAREIIANQGHNAGLRELCLRAGASVRTIERVFRREVGLDFESWRRQVRLMKGIELLVAGRPVKEVAFDVGYHQPSAFVELFRKTMGSTPRAWAASLEKAG